MSQIGMSTHSPIDTWVITSKRMRKKILWCLVVETISYKVAEVRWQIKFKTILVYCSAKRDTVLITLMARKPHCSSGIKAVWRVFLEKVIKVIARYFSPTKFVHTLWNFIMFAVSDSSSLTRKPRLTSNFFTIFSDCLQPFRSLWLGITVEPC